MILTLDKLREKWSVATCFDGLDKDIYVNLLSLAHNARDNAYAPYSSFKVGAAVLAENDIVYYGANVENASYGATICAERSAVCSAISAGEKAIKAVAVIADYPTPIPPCGMCRQVISEFGKETMVLMANTEGDLSIEKINILMPGIFVLQNKD